MKQIHGVSGGDALKSPVKQGNETRGTESIEVWFDQGVLCGTSARTRMEVGASRAVSGESRF